jgi:hypothetical protein
MGLVGVCGLSEVLEGLSACVRLCCGVEAACAMCDCSRSYMYSVG